MLDKSSTALVDCAAEMDVADASDADASNAADCDAEVLVVAAALEAATDVAKRVLAVVDVDRVAAKDAVDVLAWPLAEAARKVLFAVVVDASAMEVAANDDTDVLTLLVEASEASFWVELTALFEVELTACCDVTLMALVVALASDTLTARLVVLVVTASVAAVLKARVLVEAMLERGG